MTFTLRMLLCAALVLATTALHAQQGQQPPAPAGRGQGAGRGGPGAPQAPANGRAQAPFDLSGYWVSMVTDDWRYRMLTPPKGNADYIQVNAEARKVMDAWDPAKDEASGEACRGYGAGGIMRLPSRLHITWDDDNTMKMDIDTGTQTRRFVFGEPFRYSVQRVTSAGSSWYLRAMAVARCASEPGIDCRLKVI